MSTCLHDIGTGVLCGYPELHPVHQVTEAQGYHSFEGESRLPAGFVNALAIAQRVLERYKVDHLKWWKRMDGTPILNDIAVRMAEAFCEKQKVEAGGAAAPTPQQRLAVLRNMGEQMAGGAVAETPAKNLHPIGNSPAAQDERIEAQERAAPQPSDERAAFKSWFEKTTEPLGNPPLWLEEFCWESWAARASLERK